MIILIGASASGKTTIAKHLTSNFNFKKFVTTTTRTPRDGEINSIDYNFVNLNTFNDMIKNNEFIEYTFYNGNYYGTEKKSISDNSVLIVEFDGLKAFKTLNNPNIISYFLKSDEHSRILRMRERGDSEENIQSRINHDKFKFNENDYLKYIDKIIETDNLSIEEITNIILEDYNNSINKK